MSFKILFHLLSLTDFENIIQENKKLDIYSKEEVYRIDNYWETVIGWCKFLVKSNDEKLQNLKRAFVELDFELKVKIIDNNWVFGTFLQNNAVFSFVDKSSVNNLKYFILTFKDNVADLNLKRVNVEGSIHKIGRLLLLNKTIPNRKIKIKKIVRNWNIKVSITDEIY